MDKTKTIYTNNNIQDISSKLIWLLPMPFWHELWDSSLGEQIRTGETINQKFSYQENISITFTSDFEEESDDSEEQV